MTARGQGTVSWDYDVVDRLTTITQGDDVVVDVIITYTVFVLFVRWSPTEFLSPIEVLFLVPSGIMLALFGGGAHSPAADRRLVMTFFVLVPYLSFPLVVRSLLRWARKVFRLPGQ